MKSIFSAFWLGCDMEGGSRVDEGRVEGGAVDCSATVLFSRMGDRDARWGGAGFDATLEYSGMWASPATARRCFLKRIACARRATVHDNAADGIMGAEERLQRRLGRVAVSRPGSRRIERKRHVRTTRGSLDVESSVALPLATRLSASSTVVTRYHEWSSDPDDLMDGPRALLGCEGRPRTRAGRRVLWILIVLEAHAQVVWIQLRKPLSENMVWWRTQRWRWW
ncbi:hypothetical protein R3P38DRAFT_2759359 [Favolaschia claudopus]|uniref:Uncharacterized protein n=1 Tax=Favolaschia claudopus TaxID=2862362 RepID=A0AAW0EA70_9AGAR